MKIMYRILVILLAVAMTGIVITAIVNTDKALERGRNAIASADEFLRRYEKP